MKRIGTIFGATIAAVLAIVLIAPSFVDWTEYRDTFESRLAAASGRSVAIEGDVGLTLLPRPAFRVAGVRIGNLPGASTEEFITADTVDVILAVGPLLSGRLQFTSIEVINPIINAEVLADGRATWSVTESSDAGEAGSQNGGDDVAFDLGIDSLILVDGRLNYRDARSSVEYQLDGLSIEMRADAITGPYTLSGGTVFLGTPWQFQASVGALAAERPSTISLIVETQDAGIAANFSGQFSIAEVVPSGSGRISISGDSAAATVSAFGLVDKSALIPQPMTGPYSAQARLVLNDNSLAATAMEFSVGGATAEGGGSISWADETRFDLALKVGRLDLNSWLTGANTAPMRFSDIGGAIGIRKANAQSDATRTDFVLPSALNGALDLRVDLIEWRGQVMRNGNLSATLADAEITVADASIELPGTASIQVSGFVRAEEGWPVLDLDGKASSRNLRGFLKWIDAEPSAGLVPPSRLNALSASSRIAGTPDHMVFNDVDVTLDTTRVTGSAEYKSGTIPRIDIDAAFTNLDLDFYLPALRENLLSSSRDQDSGTQESTAPSTALANLDAFLSNMETQIKVSIGSLTAAGKVIRGIDVNASTSGGVLMLTNVLADDIAGARFELSGKVRDLKGDARFDDVKISLATENLSRTSRAFEIDIPRLPVLTGPVSVEAIASGSMQQLAMEVNGRLGDLVVSAEGGISSASSVPEFDGVLSVRHPVYTALMADLGYALPATSLPIGAVSLKSEVVGSSKTFSLSDLTLKAGDNAMTSQVVIDLAQARPNITGSLNIASVDIDALFPSDPTEDLTRASRGRSTSGSGAVSGRWSSEPFDFSALSGFDAELNVNATKAIARSVVVEQLVAPVRLSEGVLTIEDWQGQIYGGPARGNAVVSLSPVLNVTTTIEVENTLIDQIGGGADSAATASGKASLQGTFAARGASLRDLVSTLSGSGAFTATGLDAGGSGQGAFMSAVLAPVRALSQLGGLLGGGVTKGFASMAAAFNGESGVFMLFDATVKSNVYSGEFAGAIDMPRWWIEVDGRVRLQTNVLTQLLGNRLQLPSLIPVSVNGPLDSPNVKMDTTSGGAPIQQPQSPTNVPGVAPPQPRQPNPIDIFQGILNEITKPQ